MNALPTIPAQNTGENPVPKFTIDQLPSAIEREIKTLQAEDLAAQSLRGRAKLIVSAVVAAFGALGMLSVAFTHIFSPFYYGLSMVCMAGGALYFKKVIVSRKERGEKIEDLKECNKNLTTVADSLFKAHLGRVKVKEYSIEQILDVYRHFKELNKSVDKINAP